jgi:predicted aspartyl protease
MGRVIVDLVVSNNVDMVLADAGMIPRDQIRQVPLQGVVDSGANYLVLPAKVVEQLGVPSGNKVKVQDADRRAARRPTVEQVRVDLLGRHGVFRALVEADRDTALIGAIVMEDLDLLVDCKK